MGGGAAIGINVFGAGCDSVCGSLLESVEDGLVLACDKDVFFMVNFYVIFGEY